MAKNLRVQHGWWHQLKWQRAVNVKILQDLLTLLMPSHITPQPLHTPNPNTSLMSTCMRVPRNVIALLPHPNPPKQKNKKYPKCVSLRREGQNLQKDCSRCDGRRDKAKIVFPYASFYARPANCMTPITILGSLFMHSMWRISACILACLRDSSLRVSSWNPERGVLPKTPFASSS